MEIVNHTFADAVLIVGAPGGREHRVGLLFVKATLRVEATSMQADTDDPFPVLREDVPTSLGVLPQDTATELEPGYEVMVLGCAYPPLGERTCTESIVTLAVGDSRHHLRVLGDRRWVATPDGPMPSAPEPFTRMPLVWERAYGGSCEIWVDERTVLPARDWRNPAGRGMSPSALAAQISESWGAPPSFPRWEDDDRLPNLEDLETPVCSRDDAPSPACWAPLPLDCGLRMEDALASVGLAVGQEPGALRVPSIGARYWRSHPSLRFPGGAPGTIISLTGCRPDGASFALQVPPLTFGFDFQIGGVTGTRTLDVKRVVLLPDESRFYVLYAKRFAFRAPGEGDERSLRLWVA